MKALAILLALAGPALAEAPGIRTPDATRLQNLDAHLGAALREAYATGDTATLDVVEETLSGAAWPVGEVAPAGDWACRSIKLGGITPAVAYENFRCRIEETATGRWRLVKLTGSQRLAGELFVLEGMEVRYLGVGHVGAEPATNYAGLPFNDQTPVEPNQTYTQAGIFEQMSRGRARLLLPAPVLESRFDILYLTR